MSDDHQEIQDDQRDSAGTAEDGAVITQDHLTVPGAEEGENPDDDNVPNDAEGEGEFDEYDDNSDFDIGDEALNLEDRPGLSTWQYYPGGGEIGRLQQIIPHAMEGEPEPIMEEAFPGDTEAICLDLAAEGYRAQNEAATLKQKADILQAEIDLIKWHVSNNSKTLAIRKSLLNRMEKQIIQQDLSAEKIEREIEGLGLINGRLLAEAESLQVKLEDAEIELEEENQIFEEVMQHQVNVKDEVVRTRRIAAHERALKARQWKKLKQVAAQDLRNHLKYASGTAWNDLILRTLDNVRNYREMDVAVFGDALGDARLIIDEQALSQDPLQDYAYQDPEKNSSSGSDSESTHNVLRAVAQGRVLPNVLTGARELSNVEFQRFSQGLVGFGTNFDFGPFQDPNFLFPAWTLPAYQEKLQQLFDQQPIIRTDAANPFGIVEVPGGTIHMGPPPTTGVCHQGDVRERLAKIPNPRRSRVERLFGISGEKTSENLLGHIPPGNVQSSQSQTLQGGTSKIGNYYEAILHEKNDAEELSEAWTNICRKLVPLILGGQNVLKGNCLTLTKLEARLIKQALKQLKPVNQGVFTEKNQFTKNPFSNYLFTKPQSHQSLFEPRDRNPIAIDDVEVAFDFGTATREQVQHACEASVRKNFKFLRPSPRVEFLLAFLSKVCGRTPQKQDVVKYHKDLKTIDLKSKMSSEMGDLFLRAMPTAGELRSIKEALRKGMKVTNFDTVELFLVLMSQSENVRDVIEAHVFSFQCTEYCRNAEAKLKQVSVLCQFLRSNQFFCSLLRLLVKVGKHVTGSEAAEGFRVSTILSFLDTPEYQPETVYVSAQLHPERTCVERLSILLQRKNKVDKLRDFCHQLSEHLVGIEEEDLELRQEEVRQMDKTATRHGQRFHAIVTEKNPYMDSSVITAANTALEALTPIWREVRDRLNDAMSAYYGVLTFYGDQYCEDPFYYYVQRIRFFVEQLRLECERITLVEEITEHHDWPKMKIAAGMPPGKRFNEYKVNFTGIDSKTAR